MRIQEAQKAKTYRSGTLAERETVVVADLCEPLDVMNKTNQGKQTLLELTGALVHTKDLFRDAANTRVIMEMLRFTYLFTCEFVPYGPGRASQEHLLRVASRSHLVSSRSSPLGAA
jgi:hypothetical protein